MANPVEDLIKYLQLGARLDLKTIALEHVLGLTGTPEGIASIIQHRALLSALLSLLNDPAKTVAKDSILSLVNLSADAKAARALLELDPKEHVQPLQAPSEPLVKLLLKSILDPESHIADPSCMVLSNLTRPHFLLDKVVEQVELSDVGLDDIVAVFTKKQHNQVGAQLHYLGPVLSNLSQSPTVRQFILNRDKCVVQRLLPFTEYKESLIRRGGVVGTLKNCCFETEHHEWLLSEDVDLLPRLLLPLAGNEEFDEEDNDKLPLDLQYLDRDKEREQDPDIRCMLLEAITQLCTKRENRQLIRDKNTYVILRELHKWEKDRKALLACENLVDLMIRTEDEIGEEDLSKLHVPKVLSENFVAADAAYLEDS